MKFFAGKLSWWLTLKILKQCHYTKPVLLWKNFHSTLENCEKHKSLAQRILPIYGIYVVMHIILEFNNDLKGMKPKLKVLQL